MRAALLMIALGSIGLAGCQSVGSSGAPPVTGSTTPAGAASSSVAPTPTGIPAPAIPTGAALGGVLGGPVGAVAFRQRPPGGLGRAGGGARFESEALVAWRPRRIRLYRAGRRGGRRLPRLFADHLSRRPAEPRPRVGMQTAGRKLEDDELSLSNANHALARAADELLLLDGEHVARLDVQSLHRALASVGELSRAS